MSRKSKSKAAAMKVRYGKSQNRNNSCIALNSCYNKPSISGDGDFYALVVQRVDREWHYVSANDGYLDISHKPCVFHINEAENLVELWERVVIHNAIPWNDNVFPETLRIISYKTIVDDKTLFLFEQIKKENATQVLMKSALAKLTDAEARALKLDNNLTLNRIFHDPVFSPQDKRLLKGLSDNNPVVGINDQLEKLNEL